MENQPKKDIEQSNLLYEFAVETTAHGVAKVAKADSRVKRTFWTLALILASITTILMISYRLESYFLYSTVTEINKRFTTKIDFPAVTVCNFNKIKKSYLHGTNAKAMALLNDVLNERFTDEDNEVCGQCTSNQFRCHDDINTCCIPLQWKCDQYADCMDGSDENGCIVNYLHDYFSEAPEVDVTNNVTMCGNTSLIHGLTGWITTKSFGSAMYENYLDCHIEIPTQKKNYFVAKLWISLEAADSCVYDKLSIGAVDFCGLQEKHLAFDIQSLQRGENIEILFKTDHLTTNVGFAIHWTLSDDSGDLDVVNITSALSNSGGNDITEEHVHSVCGERDQLWIGYNESPTTIISHTSYGYGQFYRPDSNCSIEVHAYEVALSMKFHELGIDGDYPNCNTDYLIIEYDNQINRYCGFETVNIDTVILENTSFTLHFVSDNANESYGFGLVVKMAMQNSTDDYIYYISTNQPSTQRTTQSLIDTTATPEEFRRRKRRSFNTVDLYELVRKRRQIPTSNSSNFNSSVKTSTELCIDMAGMKFSTNILEGGWLLTDRPKNTSVSSNETFTLLHCSFRGVKCNSKWFKHSFTPFGNCYTFNTNGWLDSDTVKPLPTPLNQIQPGPNHGLNLIIDIQRYEYSENLAVGSPQVGLKFQVHSAEESSDIENKGLAVSSGQHVYAGFKMTRVLNIEPPWGLCNKSLSLKYSTLYSFHQCAIECKLEYVVQECGCKPFYYPGPAPECSASLLKNCAIKAIAKIDLEEFANRCYCPASCDYHDVDMRMSYVEFGGTESILQEMNTKYYNVSATQYPRNDSSYYKKNAVSLNIYFDELSITEMKQLKAMEESSLLSDIGGQMGLFIGVSVLTVCEMLETCFLAISKCWQKRRHRKIAEQWATRVIAVKAQKNAER